VIWAVLDRLDENNFMKRPRVATTDRASAVANSADRQRRGTATRRPAATRPGSTQLLAVSRMPLLGSGCAEPELLQL